MVNYVCVHLISINITIFYFKSFEWHINEEEKHIIKQEF